EKTNVDLIISDWNMDDIDGLTLLKVIRKHPRTQAMPFIMATGRSDKEQVKEAISFGVNNYIIKPFDAMTMKKRIEAVIGALTWSEISFSFQKAMAQKGVAFGVFGGEWKKSGLRTYP